MSLSINLSDLEKSGQQPEQNEQQRQQSGDFLSNIDQTLARVVNILEKIEHIKNNPEIANFIASRMGDRQQPNIKPSRPQKSQKQNQKPGNLQQESEDNSNQFDRIIKALKFVKQQKGEDYTVGELLDYLSENEQTVKKIIERYS